MRSEPQIAAAAALIGNPGRAAILTSLMDGRALPANELAAADGLLAEFASVVDAVRCPVELRQCASRKGGWQKRRVRRRLAAGGRRIRTLGPSLGSGLDHTSPPEVALPIARQFIQCLLWRLLPEQGFRH